jgi:stress response protein YsnF
VREEGDCIIFPVVEEVLKVQRVLMLKEEVRIRRVKGTERYQERVTLRKQEAVVNRLPIEEATAEQAHHEVSDAKENV